MQLQELAREADPSHSKTVDVRPIEDFFELRERGGVLANLNARVFFGIDKEARALVILGAINKQNNGPTPDGDRIRMRRRCANTETGIMAVLIVDRSGFYTGLPIMTTKTKEMVDVHANTSSNLALAVLTERIQSLPAEDKADLYELSKAWFTAESEEECQSARFAMQEILEQQTGGIVPVRMADAPGQDLDTWVKYIGAKIREKREAAGFTQQQLEERSGLPQSHISRLENGQHSPSYATLEKIAAGLGIPVSDLEPCV